MNASDTTRLHPLHALYVGRSHGELSTPALRPRKGAHLSDKTARGDAALLAGFGLAVAALAASHLAGKVTRGK